LPRDGAHSGVQPVAAFGQRLKRLDSVFGTFIDPLLGQFSFVEWADSGGAECGRWNYDSAVVVQPPLEQ